MCAKKADNRSFQTFLADLKSDELSSVVFMYGPEQYLVKWAVEMVKKKYIDKASEVMDYVVLDEEHIEPSEIIEACETFSMLSSKRVIWVKNFAPMGTAGIPKDYTEAEIEALADYIENSNDNAILVFSHDEPNGKSGFVKKLKKAAKSYEFVSLNRRELASFAGKRFKAAGVEIRPAELSMLLNATGYENNDSDYRLYNFENDIMKVIAHSNGERIAADDIDATIEGDNATFVFDMLDGISGNNKSIAFEIINNRIKGDYKQIPVITGAIASQMETMYIIKEFQVLSEHPENAASIHEYTGINEYRIKKLMRYTNKYSLEKIRGMLSNIYEVNINIITGLLDGQTALEMFVAGI